MRLKRTNEFRHCRRKPSNWRLLVVATVQRVAGLLLKTTSALGTAPPFSRVETTWLEGHTDEVTHLHYCQTDAVLRAAPA